MYSYEASVTEMLNVLGWRTLQERRFVSRQTMLYKTIAQQTACTIPDYIVPSASTRRASHCKQYNVPVTTLDAYKFSYFPRTIRAWTILPAGIVEASNPDIFKAELQKAFLDGRLHMIPPKSRDQPLRLGSTKAVAAVGPVY